MRSQIEPMLYFALVFIFFISGGHSVQFTITNNCQYQIWPATLANYKIPALSETGFLLAPGKSQTLDAPSTWSGHIWARIHCSTDSTGHFSCLVGDCGTGQVPCNGNGGAKPVTLVKLTHNDPKNANKDTYDISLVDGSNIPVSVVPAGSGCTTIACKGRVNQLCPDQLKVKDPASGGEAPIACKSTCTASNNDARYCCTGSYESAAACVRTDYTQMAKRECPQAYSFAADDQSSTFTCPGGSGYTITFCPS